MKDVKVPKLVRDKMPEIWDRYGDKAEYTTVSGDKLKTALLDKVVEEAEEVHADPCVDEFADLLEILIASAQYHGFTYDDVRRAMDLKRAKRGGFEKGIYLTKFEWGSVR